MLRGPDARSGVASGGVMACGAGLASRCGEGETVAARPVSQRGTPGEPLCGVPIYAPAVWLCTIPARTRTGIRVRVRVRVKVRVRVRVRVGGVTNNS
jgi:hypothetical protein